MTQTGGARRFDSKAFVKSLPARPGVYRMLNDAREILYVGKARSLHDRVGSYFHASSIAKTQLEASR